MRASGSLLTGLLSALIAGSLVFTRCGPLRWTCQSLVQELRNLVGIGADRGGGNSKQQDQRRHQYRRPLPWPLGCPVQGPQRNGLAGDPGSHDGSDTEPEEPEGDPLTLLGGSPP